MKERAGANKVAAFPNKPKGIDEMAKRTKDNETPESVKNFDQLPDSARIDISCVMALTSKGRSTIYRWIDQGIIPRPRKFGPTQNFWTAGDIRRALGM